MSTTEISIPEELKNKLVICVGEYTSVLYDEAGEAYADWNATIV